MLQIPDEIKELLHRDSCQKNIRIHFPNGERSDICNNLIVKDSVSFTESLCSQNTFKFGLCEAPTFECEVVGVGNIKGATIRVYCEIYCDSSVTGAIWQNDLMAYVYQIPYGDFIVKDAKRQADMNHRKITAYGGQAYYDWTISNNEIEKICKASNYTPNLGYFLMANGVNILSDYLDKTEISWSGDSFYLFNVNELRFGGYRIQVTMNFSQILFGTQFAADRDAVYQSDAEISQKKGITSKYLLEEMYKFFYQYSSSSSVEFTDTDNEIMRLLDRVVKGYVNYYDNGAGRDTAGTRNAYFYPFSNSFYTDNNRYSSYNMGTSIEFKLYDDHTLLATETISLINQTPKLYKYKYKNSVPSWTSLQLKIPCSTSTYFIDYGKINVLNLSNALAEIEGGYIKFNRDNIFDATLLNIKQLFGLTPSDSLYPGSNVYPEGATGGKLLPNDYQSCWYEDDYTKPWGVVQCKYKDSSNVEHLYIYYLTGFSQGIDIASYNTYDLTDNAIIQGNTWTETQISEICQQIADNIEGVTYMPVEFVGRGLPYVEAGDTFEILTASNDSITTIVLNRTITGEQVLTDSYKSVS